MKEHREYGSWSLMRRSHDSECGHSMQSSAPAWCGMSVADKVRLRTPIPFDLTSSRPSYPYKRAQ